LVSSIDFIPHRRFPVRLEAKFSTWTIPTFTLPSQMLLLFWYYDNVYIAAVSIANMLIAILSDIKYLEYEPTFHGFAWGKSGNILLLDIVFNGYLLTEYFFE